MNKFGLFHYEDFAVGAKESAVYHSDSTLQDGSSLDQLQVGVEPIYLSSLEQDAYVTRRPELNYVGNTEIGFTTAEISDESGNFAIPVKIEVDFFGYYSMTGITISSRNILKNVKIAGFQNFELVAEQSFSATSKEQFYPIVLDLIDRVEITVYSINEPFHFLGIFDIQYGKLRIFDSSKIESARITNNFSVLADTIEYDTLDLSVISPDSEEYLFQRKQPVYFIDDGVKKAKFFVDSGDEHENHTIDILAYDQIANMENDFLGGIYKKKSVAELIGEILGSEVEYRIEFEDSVVSGYIPICSRRKALQMVLLASNIRLYREDVFIFKPLESVAREEKLDKTNIIGNPQKSKKQPVRSVRVKKHNYSKKTERSEVHHWYLSQTKLTQINFSSPMHDLRAHEVIGVDENGNDILDTVQSVNVGFNKVGDNYCIVHCYTDNKVVITGAGYSDSTENFYKENPIIGNNLIYTDIEVDLTLSGDAQAVCDLLYDLHSKKDSVKFNTLENVQLGGLYSILGNDYYIKKKKNTLNGVYEVEAV